MKTQIYPNLPLDTIVFKCSIFSDKVISFGTDFRALGKFGYNGYGLEGDLDEGGCRIFAAQSFLFGQQMGWMLPNVYDIMPYHDYYKTLVRERETLLDFFNAGRLLRPPVVSDDAPKTVCNYCREGAEGPVPPVPGL